jgi:hypothetical protein
MLVDVSVNGSMIYSPHTFPGLVERRKYELSHEVGMLSKLKKT